MLRRLLAAVVLSGCGVDQPLVSGQRLIGRLTAREGLVAFTDGAEASTRPGLEGIVVKVVDRHGRRVLEAPIDLDGERRAVRALALGTAAVASLETKLVRGTLRVLPFDGSAPIAPEVSGWVMGVAATADGFTWIEAGLTGLRDADADGTAEAGVVQLSLVESDPLGEVRSRRPISTDAPIVEPTSRLLPLPTPVGLAVQGTRALFAWDASGVCGGRATVFEVDLAAASAQLLWQGRAAATDSACTCLPVADNGGEALDGVAFDPGGAPVLVGRVVPCAALVGGASFTVRGAHTWQSERWVHGLVGAPDGVYAVADDAVVRLGEDGFRPVPGAPRGQGTALRGVALLGDRLVVAEDTVVRLGSAR